MLSDVLTADQDHRWDLSMVSRFGKSVPDLGTSAAELRGEPVPAQTPESVPLVSPH